MLLLITGITNPWIYGRHYGHRMAFNPMIQWLVCCRHYKNRVISPNVINTTLRTWAISSFWFALQHDDPNHLSQEVPKPYLRIRYSLDKCRHSDLFVYVIFIFFSKKTPSISYKILHMRLLYINPCRDVIVRSYVDVHWLKKGRGRPLLDEG